MCMAPNTCGPQPDWLRDNIYLSSARASAQSCPRRHAGQGSHGRACIRMQLPRRHTLLDECSILLVHGLLHLLGYDHEAGAEAHAAGRVPHPAGARPAAPAGL